MKESRAFKERRMMKESRAFKERRIRRNEGQVIQVTGVFWVVGGWWVKA